MGVVIALARTNVMEGGTLTKYEAVRKDITKTVDGLKLALERRAAELLDRVNQIETADTEEENNRSVALTQQRKPEKELVFAYDDALEEACKSFGQVCATCVSPGNCIASGEGVSEATVDEAAVVTVHLFNENGSRCMEDVLVSVHLLDALGECGAKGVRETKENNLHTFKYFPKEPGMWQLHVRVRDSNIRGSPFSVRVERPLHLRCNPRGVINRLSRPMGLTVGASGELVVVENRGYSTISVYTPNLEWSHSFASWGTGEGQCQQPRGVCFDTEGNILVVDGENHRLHKFSPTGKLLKTVGSHGFGPLQFLSPTGITCSPSGLVYVADRNNHRIQILRSNDLSFLFSFGRKGCGPGDLCLPWDVAIDSQGSVYVTDTGHSCVKKFASHGEFKLQISRYGKSEDELVCPMMLCIDSNDFVYVTDRLSNKLSVFDSSGQFRLTLGIQGGSGADLGQIREPAGVAVGLEGQVYVSELHNNRVQVFY